MRCAGSSVLPEASCRDGERGQPEGAPAVTELFQLHGARTRSPLCWDERTRSACRARQPEARERPLARRERILKITQIHGHERARWSAHRAIVLSSALPQHTRSPVWLSTRACPTAADAHGAHPSVGTFVDDVRVRAPQQRTLPALVKGSISAEATPVHAEGRRPRRAPRRLPQHLDEIVARDRSQVSVRRR